ncbi:serine hydrolase domain-containing protein [Gaoshiqia sediminis]|uniref:Beta-lactamase family protein n=1 Tax=Gaoshiqia sediminis TaxID=2986998 RepID=A0AA42C661_9BACT|nr:serine hydrolase domain-containing protein [Gaoshiqia sediminis]MCW0482209.1 beta-lactamase family protein [Gaoshiqia sediminis]
MMKTRQLKISELLRKGMLPITLILLIFSSCSTKKPNSRVVLNKQYKDEILAGREDLKMHLITASTTGISVAVSIDGEMVWSEGMGYADKEVLAPAKPETKFRIGRTTHMLTAMLIAKLQEEGKLNVQDSFYKYIPEFPKKQFDFNLYQLGVYSAGFNEDELSKLATHEEYINLKEYIQSQATDTLAYPPNEYYAVSDYGMAMLGILAEDITETNFAKLMKETILDTLGLHETVIDNPLLITENRAAPYYQNYIAQVVNAPAIDLRYCAPAHGYLSTADDLNKLGQAILKAGFFSQESLDLFFTKNVLNNGFETNRGFGWWISEDMAGRKIYVQAGSTVGGSSMLAVYPEQKLVVSLCANISDDLGQLPGQKIANTFLAKIDPRKQPEEPVSKEEKPTSNE